VLDHIKLLVFDLDYLIFDCASLRVRALRQSLISFADTIPQDIRLPDAMDAEEGYLLHGFRWTQFLEIGLEEERLAELQHVYRINEDRLLEAGAGQIYPGVLDELANLRSNKLALALGAEASREYLLSVSDRHDLADLFDISLCTQEFGVGSTDEMLEEIMHQCEVNRSETVVLGTRPSFFEAAHNLNALAVGCGWGIHHHGGLGNADLQSLTLATLFPAIQKADELSAHSIDY
jgi:phosphoglycolate phosphatase-like HAD superfamily hydrolase